MAEDTGSVEADRHVEVRPATATASTSAELPGGLFGHDLLSRVKTQLGALRGQVGRLNRALANSEKSRAAAIERLDQADMLRRRSSPVGLAPDGERVPERAEHVYSVWVNEDHLHALVETGLLHPGDVGSRASVAKALRRAMDLWSGRQCAARPSHGGGAAELAACRGAISRSETTESPKALDGDNVIPFRPAASSTPAASTPRRQGALRFGAKAPLCSGASSGRAFGKRRRLGAPAAHDTDSVDGERQPDHGERADVGQREPLAVNVYRQKEMAGRGDVLQQADGRQPDPLCSGDEQEQR